MQKAMNLFGPLKKRGGRRGIKQRAGREGTEGQKRAVYAGYKKAPTTREKGAVLSTTHKGIGKKSRKTIEAQEDAFPIHPKPIALQSL